MTVAGVPPEVVAGFGQATSTGALDLNNLTGVGDLGAAILAAVPAAVQGVISPFITQIVLGIQAAFSLAVAQTFWIGVGRGGHRRDRGLVHDRARTPDRDQPGRGARDRAGDERHRTPGQRTRWGVCSGDHGPPDRLTFAPPLIRRPRWTPPGPSFISDR